MRLYHRSQKDRISGINRCFFDADHGRVQLALERLQDLDNEFPDDSHILYAEGLIRKDYLGQGVKAGQLFQKAYELDNTHAFAANNATKFARNEQEFRKWAQILLRVSNKDKTAQRFVRSILRDLESGVSYWELMLHGSQAHSANQQFGDSAALMELALLTNQMIPDEEVKVRRVRAQNIRSLDAKEEAYRNTIMEAFPPEERLALHEALAELERALALDEYDPELWNLKAAWCYLLGRFSEAIEFADKAIELRPLGYPKPYHNKAAALRGLKRDKEALECAHESLKQAESNNELDDIERSHKMIEDFSIPLQTPKLSDVEPIFGHICNAARVTADLEIGQWHGSVDKLVNGVLKRTSLVGNNTMACVLIMAELLSDFAPETAWYILLKTAEKDQKAHEHCLHAALYVAAHSIGVQQRDAARFLALSILGAVKGVDIRRVYREAILETSAAATDEMSRLDQIMREELGRINPLFPQLLADQEPVDERGHARATHNILSRFTSVPPRRLNNLPDQGSGCMKITLAVIFLLALITALIVILFI